MRVRKPSRPFLRGSNSWLAPLSGLLVACGGTSGTTGADEDTGATEGDVSDVSATDGADVPGPGTDTDDDTAGGPDTTQCPPTSCTETGNPACTGGLGYTVCAPGPDGCLDRGEFVPCDGERTCAAGKCFGGCTHPEVVFVVDRSVPMKGTRYAQLFQGLKRAIERTTYGVSYGIVFTGDAACDVGDTVAPAKDQGAALIAALQSAGTGDAQDVALAPALEAAAGLLGDRGEAERIVLLTANEALCGGLEATTATVERLRERDARLRVLWLGAAAGSEVADALAKAGGTDDARVALDGESITQAVIDLLDDLETCCIDPDGDTRGQFCQGGIDCDESNDLVWSSNCIDKECGDDGCGGSCGVCTQVNGGTTACVDFQCETTCADAHHACLPSCVPNDAVTSCGDRCDPCPVPTGGAAACVADAAAPLGHRCAEECPDGQHPCGGACVASDSPLHCGDLCDPCPTADNADPVCVEGACAIQCHDDFLDCGGCVACPTFGVATTACSATQACVAATCEPGFVLCQPDENGTPTACCDRVVEVLDDGADLAAYPAVGVAYPDTVIAAWHRETTSVGEVVVSRAKAGFAVPEVISTANAPANGRYTRVSLDKIDTPRVAWRAGTTASGASITMATRTADAWSTLELASTFSPISYPAGDFAFAAGTAQQFAVYNATDELGYATGNGVSAVQTVFADEAGAEYNDTPAALVDDDGHLHVLVVEDDDTVVLLTGIDGSTTRVVVDTIGNVGAHRLDIAAQADGTIGYCWLDNTIGGDRGVLYGVDGDPLLAKVSVDKDAEEACELAYTPADMPVLAYRSIKGEIRIARGVGDGLWTFDNVAAPSAKGLGLRWPGLAIHPNGAESVVFWDGDAGTVNHVFFPAKAP